MSAFTTSEARYFDEERYSESELRKALDDSVTEKKIDAMKRILAAVSVGRDASSLFPQVVKNVSFSSLELKKLIYIYLVQYAENNRDLALLSINSFQRDLADRSQLVRTSALRAMASIRVLEVIQLVVVAVKNASIDSSPYVRKTAAHCMTKVYAVDPDQFYELRGLLLKLMGDPEVQVVGSAAMSFHHMCVLQPPRVRDDGSEFLPSDAVVRSQLELLHPLYRRLCDDMLLMDHWAQQSCVDLLQRYCRLFFACPCAPLEAEGQPVSVASGDHRAFLRALKMLLFSSSRGVTLSAAVAVCYVAPRDDMIEVIKPLLRCLRQAPTESAHTLLAAIMPIIEARPDLFRASIRDFFVQSFDFAEVKKLKINVLVKLVDDTNVQLVLRELQAYVSWHCHTKFVGQAVQSISHVALKRSSVADQCLRGLVKMLDSKCEAVSSEAVVALRALLHQRQKNSDSGLGSVLPHLVRYLDDLTAPTARASVVWIIGQYQQEVLRLAPDVVRKLAKTFVSERQDVKQQILLLSLRVWACHYLNCQEGLLGEKMSQEESSKLLPRLDALFHHITTIASYDSVWDVRDGSRAVLHIKQSASGDATAFGASYCRACLTGTALSDTGAEDEGPSEVLDCTWILGSLAQSLDFALDTYRALPAWSSENTPDELRSPVVQAPAASTAVKSISSANVGNVQHMEKRVENPSNIKHIPQVQTLEDLDLFYSHEAPSIAARALEAKPKPSAVPEAPTTLEQFQLRPPFEPVGTAVFGEDDESDEEEEESDDEDDWRYCQQAQGATLTVEPSAAAVRPADEEVSETSKAPHPSDNQAFGEAPTQDATKTLPVESPAEGAQLSTDDVAN